MSISISEIRHVAELARLRLSPEEENSLAKELDAILAYIEQLQTVDTTAVEATAQVSGLLDVARNDDVIEWPRAEVETALNQGDREGDYLKVKKVL